MLIDIFKLNKILNQLQKNGNCYVRNNANNTKHGSIGKMDDIIVEFYDIHDYMIPNQFKKNISYNKTRIRKRWYSTYDSYHLAIDIDSTNIDVVCGMVKTKFFRCGGIVITYMVDINGKKYKGFNNFDILEDYTGLSVDIKSYVFDEPVYDSFDNEVNVGDRVLYSPMTGHSNIVGSKLSLGVVVSKGKKIITIKDMFSGNNNKISHKMYIKFSDNESIYMEDIIRKIIYD